MLDPEETLGASGGAGNDAGRGWRKARGVLGCAMRRKESVAAGARSYTVLLQPEPEGGYTVTRPTLPGLVTYGGTLEEARAMAADALMHAAMGQREYVLGEVVPG